jgi:mannose-6-phosphate isomerase-like protein (cupin superfamily)
MSEHFSVLHAGPWADLEQAEFRAPKLPAGVKGKRFLKEELGLTSMELSLNKVPAGGGIPFLHRHQDHEEVYLFVKGSGQMQVDGKTFEVREGTVVRVSPEGARAWRNTSKEDLYFVCIQAPAGGLRGNTIQDGRGVEQPLRWD